MTPKWFLLRIIYVISVLFLLYFRAHLFTVLPVEALLLNIFTDRSKAVLLLWIIFFFGL